MLFSDLLVANAGGGEKVNSGILQVILRLS